MERLIIANGVSFGYGGKAILEDVSLSIKKGEFLGILGANGAGKSTLLKLLRGLLRPSSGDIAYKYLPLNQWRGKDLSMEMALVPQSIELFVPMTAFGVVSLGRTPYLKGWFEGRNDIEMIRKSMELTDVSGLAERDFHTLSGGERRRVILAKALAQEPKVLLLDEPTDDLDIRHQGEFMSVLKGFKESGMTIILTSHNINIVSEYCDRVVLIKDKRVYASGKPEEVMTAAIINEVFEWETAVDRNPLSGRPRVTPVYK